MSFEELSHTADVKIRVRSPTLDALFSEACIALMQVMYGKDRKPGICKKISLGAADTKSLLSDFLSEILFLSEVESLVIARADVKIEGSHLTAILAGEPFDPLRHNQGTEVKGISYSGMLIEKETNGYMLEILFDV
ncbi:MAG: archease [Methanoregula sp.]|nr:archease [Methanoregula sp.]